MYNFFVPNLVQKMVLRRPPVEEYQSTFFGDSAPISYAQPARCGTPPTTPPPKLMGAAWGKPQTASAKTVETQWGTP